MPRSSQEKSEETRARIVEEAHRLFTERGYHGTSMRDVSRAAGLTVGAIYNHFPTKEDLWQEVLFVKHPYHVILPLVQSADGKTIAELVHSAAGLMVQELLKRPDLLNLMFIEIVEFNSRHLYDLFQMVIPGISGLSATIMSKQGKLRQIPMPVLLRSFIGLFFSYYVTGILMNIQDVATIDAQSLDQFVELYLYGILADDDPSRADAAYRNLPGDRKF
jgi:AcrR family transcriptional regulator